jgi:hypothetical protein
VPEYNPASVPVSAGTPYVLPSMLLAAPTGIQWSTVGATVRPTDQQQFDEQLNLCRRATSMIDGYCNQPLRATIDTETLFGPGDLRFQMRNAGVARLLLSRSPVTSVIGGQVSVAASFPAQWTTIPANGFKIEKPVIGVYGTTSPGGSGDGGAAVLLGPGYVSWWWAGRYGYQVEVQYVNGWPHGSLTEAAAAGDVTVSVDDCTGWGPPAGLATGAVGTLHDPGNQEIFTVSSATATSGPGLLTLTAPLAYEHPVGVMATTLPESVIQAGILFCVSQALVRGATATTIQAVPGSGAGTGGVASAMHHAVEAEHLIHPYRRII